MAFVDDFFSASPTEHAQQNFDLFKWFVKLLGFSLKERKETPEEMEVRGTIDGLPSDLEVGRTDDNHAMEDVGSL